VLRLLGLLFTAVVLIVVLGEWLGLFEPFTESIPWYVALPVILAAGFPVFRNVVRAALRGQVISHTLMTVGVIAAAAVGEWATAAIVVFFMRVGDYAERFTTEGARQAVKNLAALSPQTARVERMDENQVWHEVVIPIGAVQVGETVIIRPGEKVPIDGVVLHGQATLDQSAITGEAMPVEAGPGSAVFAATLVRLGSLRVRVDRVGEDTTFGKIIHLVQEAEAHRAGVQRVADRFSAYYLPVVAAIAALTFVLRRDPLATAAVLVVACSCSFALATPIAMLASIGAAARRGLLFKGGKYIETLARANVLLVDKTGTLTLGKPQITGLAPEAGTGEEELIRFAASAERYSEHPLAEAVRRMARQHGVDLLEVDEFRAEPGIGVQARLDGKVISVGRFSPSGEAASGPGLELAEDGKTLIEVRVNGERVGLLAAEDTLRPDAARALEDMRRLGFTHIELLTGDHLRAAGPLAAQLGIPFRAGLLPQDKIQIVRDFQAAGRLVVMVGDGVNDAPALAQADVGIAMTAAGTDVAIEAAHVAVMTDQWKLIPDSVRIARRTMRVVYTNIAFTTVYNLAGLTLAALGFLPPMLAAAAQSIPDLGILANSSRLLRQKID
jgi:Cd2+/Zn2+-exporting ATPase/Cu+-exporting ATPase